MILKFSLIIRCLGCCFCADAHSPLRIVVCCCLLGYFSIWCMCLLNCNRVVTVILKVLGSLFIWMQLLIAFLSSWHQHLSSDFLGYESYPLKSNILETLGFQTIILLLSTICYLTLKYLLFFFSNYCPVYSDWTHRRDKIFILFVDTGSQNFQSGFAGTGVFSEPECLHIALMVFLSYFVCCNLSSGCLCGLAQRISL